MQIIQHSICSNSSPCCYLLPTISFLHTSSLHSTVHLFSAVE
uniref:Uncharacterized protein n=1 Tax=Anguilla anguilla TaxID=7936 RepID=A0A0E9TRQ6_ANGAN